jgi:hypothetical protein
MDNPSYKNSFPHNIHPVSITKVKRSMKCREITAICSETHINTPTLSVGKRKPFSNLDKEGHIITTETEGFHIRSQQSD